MIYNLYNSIIEAILYCYDNTWWSHDYTTYVPTAELFSSESLKTCSISMDTLADSERESHKANSLAFHKLHSEVYIKNSVVSVGLKEGSCHAHDIHTSVLCVRGCVYVVGIQLHTCMRKRTCANTHARADRQTDKHTHTQTHQYLQIQLTYIFLPNIFSSFKLEFLDCLLLEIFKGRAKTSATDHHTSAIPYKVGLTMLAP